MRKKQIIKNIALVVIIALVVAVFVIFRKPIVTFARLALIEGDKGSLKQFLKDLGIFGPLLLIFLQIVFLVVPFFPSEPLLISAGVGYGIVFGFLVCCVGVLVGNQIVFLLHKFIKRPHKKSKKQIEAEELIKNSKRSIWWILLLLYALPAFTYGVVALLAISSGLNWRRYTVLTSACIIPLAFTVALGNTLAIANPVVSIAVMVFLICVVIFSIFYRDKIIGVIFKEKKSREQKIDELQVRKPSRLLCKTLVPLATKSAFKKANTTVYSDIDLKTYNKQCVILLNHPSKMDINYIASAFLKFKPIPNVIVNRYFFNTKLLGGLVKKLGCIPKKTFQPDLRTVKNILIAAKQGHSFVIAPEGINSMAGESMGVVPSTAKFLKKLDIPVIAIKINGAFLTKPRWDKGGKMRKGRVDVFVRELFSASELREKTIDEIYDKLEKEIYYDDFAWASENKVEFKSDNLAAQIDNALYLCPKCGSEFKIVVGEGSFACIECGNGASINKYYELVPLDETCIIPKSISAWYNLQRASVIEKAQSGNFSMETKAKLRMLNKSGKEVVVGEGNLRLTAEGLIYTYTSGYDRDIAIPLQALRGGICTSFNDSIELYYEDVFYLFAMEQPKTSVKWGIAVEQLLKTI